MKAGLDMKSLKLPPLFPIAAVVGDGTEIGGGSADAPSSLLIVDLPVGEVTA